MNTNKKTAIICILIILTGILALTVNIYVAKSKLKPEDGIMVKRTDIYEW